MNPISFESGVSDIQPGELVGSCIGVADDIAAPERQDGAGDRLRQRGEHDARDKKGSCRRPVAARRGGDGRGHEPLPQIDLDTRGQAGHEAAGQWIAGKPDLHRNALNDANEVPCRIVCGEQAEGRPAAGRKAVHHAFKRLVRVAVDR